MARKPEDDFDPSERDTATPGPLDLADIDPAGPSRSRPQLTPAEAVEVLAEAELPTWSTIGRKTGTRKATGRRKTGLPTGIRKATDPDKKS